ncbi:hypothetical protein DD829_00295 [Chryseobacterium sp. HMWF035]|nr:hypothetical protein DD829_00295 [Chryseobacterium sp. HMWF035]
MTAVFTFGVMTVANAQQTEVKTRENSLLEASLKSADAKSENSLFYINKKETDIETVKKIPAEDIKYVMVLKDDKIRKKFKEKGITQIVMITTKS